MKIVKVQPELPDWPSDHMNRYLASNGEEGHYVDFRPIGGYELTPTLILTTTGRRSGKPISLPLIYGAIDDAWIIIGSKGGAPTHPGWYLNLRSNSQARVQIKDRRFTVKARIAKGTERAKLWAEMAKIYPPFDQYQQMTTREIPVIVLQPA